MIKKFNVEKTRQLDKINRLLAFFYRKRRTVEIVELKNVKNILVIDFALMGDMVMDIPFFKTIKHNCPNAKITMVCMKWAEIILGDQDLVDEFIVFDGKEKLSTPKKVFRNFGEIRSTLKEINKKEYDLGIEPKGDLRHTLFMHYTRSKRTASYNYTGGGYLITDSFNPKENTRHLIDEKLDLLEMLGFTIFDEDRIPELYLADKGIELCLRFKESNHLQNKTIIGIHPGASNVNKQFRYYPEVLNDFFNKIKNKEKFILIVFEGPNEEEIANKVSEQAKIINVNYIKVKRPTKEYVQLVSICDYMLCNDSAAAHIAAGYGIPTLVVFGAVKPETALPRGKNIVEYVSHAMDCKPCTLPTCPLNTEKCIKSISPKEVVDKLYKIGLCV